MRQARLRLADEALVSSVRLKFTFIIMYFVSHKSHHQRTFIRDAVEDNAAGMKPPIQPQPDESEQKEKGKEKEAGPSKPTVEEITEGLSGTFMANDSDSTIELPP